MIHNQISDGHKRFANHTLISLSFQGALPSNDKLLTKTYFFTHHSRYHVTSLKRREELKRQSTYACNLYFTVVSKFFSTSVGF